MSAQIIDERAPAAATSRSCRRSSSPESQFSGGLHPHDRNLTGNLKN